MGKRRHAFVFLSDDEDSDHEDRQMLPLQKKPPLAPNASSLGISTKIEGCRAAKRTDGSSTRTPECSHKGLHCTEHGVVKGRQGVNVDLQNLKSQPWIEKYRPKEISDLAVHSKKIAEVCDWMGKKLQNVDRIAEVCDRMGKKLQNVDKLDIGGNVLVLLGPTGAGKTAVVHTLVNLFQMDLCEWDPPVPTLWEEHLHHVNSDVPYISKVNQFISFLEKVKRYPRLPLVQMTVDEESMKVLMGSTSCQKPKVLLLDDLPIVYGREISSQVCCCLHNFALSVQFPTIVILTDFLEKEEYGQGTILVTADMIQALQSGGARTITFNPLTSKAIAKVLNRIVAAENYSVPSESLSFIAESCGGDIRHAINSLQFLCVGLSTVSCAWDPGGSSLLQDNSTKRRGSKDTLRNKRSVKRADITARALSVGCRDGVLSLFHALGKVLYNKRLIEVAKDSGETSINMVLKDDLQRHPLNMDTPETLIAESHTDATSFLNFLHENALEFIDDEGIEDVSVAATYFSDVDCFLGFKHKGPRVSSRFTLPGMDEIDSGHIAEAVAGSVAARGILFANTHPAKHRWQSLRAPAMRQVEQILRKKKAERRAKSWECSMYSLTMITGTAQVTECEPFFRQLGYPSLRNQAQNPIQQKNVSVQISEDESDAAISWSQEENLMPNIMAIDISKEADGQDCEDEIEEW